MQQRASPVSSEGEAVCSTTRSPASRGFLSKNSCPFYDYFQAVLETDTDVLDKDIRYQQKVLHGSIFSIEKHYIVGGFFRTSRFPIFRRTGSSRRRRNIIRKHLSTVQKIAFSSRGERRRERGHAELHCPVLFPEEDV